MHGVPLNETPLTLVKPLPLIITCVPTSPLAGVNPLIVGGNRTVKSLALVPVPSALVTLMGPFVAPAGTIARSSLSETSVMLFDDTPLKETSVVPVKFKPDNVTSSPTGPLDGVNDVIDGINVTVNTPALLVVPPALVTLITPVVVPAATVARN